MPELPLVLVHVRLTTTGVDIAATDALRDALKATIEGHAESWGMRIKRRIVQPRDALRLWDAYEQRDAERRSRPIVTPTPTGGRRPKAT